MKQVFMRWSSQVFSKQLAVYNAVVSAVRSFSRALAVAIASVFAAVGAAADTLAVTVPDAYSEGVDFTAVVAVIGIIGGGVIGVFLAVKLIRWILSTFV